MLFIAIRLRRIEGWVPYHRYWRSAAWQLLDWILASTLISLPLLFLGGVSGSTLIGGVRLAQSLLGPLNLAFAAAITNLIADAVTRGELAAAHSLISRGTLIGRLLTGLSIIVVLVAISFFYITKIDFRGVISHDLIVGLVLVGAWAITSAWEGVRATILRLLGWQARATLSRGITAILTLSVFTVAYYWGGVDVSLIFGFITLALTPPVVITCLSRKVYRGISRISAAPPQQLTYERAKH
jgi:hypothetical protein